mmetsp:Transcript_28138/g.38677  ORF Transcript_28138/g.38677 Transcript_28138/m.38677 type:complete len:88 (-) Transcript_28138:157-420(-)
MEKKSHSLPAFEDVFRTHLNTYSPQVDFANGSQRIPIKDESVVRSPVIIREKREVSGVRQVTTSEEFDNVKKIVLKKPRTYKSIKDL